jgi:hypothetical protein
VDAMDMLAELQVINDSDTVWIYQASRRLNEVEQRELLASGREFCASWATHGKPLDAAVFLMDGLFVIVKVNSALMAASGCSIDKSLQWIRNMEKQFGITLLDRMQVAWVDEAGNIERASLNDAKAAFACGGLTNSCKVFNHSISNGADLKTKWLDLLPESWLMRFLN